MKMDSSDRLFNANRSRALATAVLVASLSATGFLFGQQQGNGIQAGELKSRTVGKIPAKTRLFTKVPSSESGISFVNPIDTTHPLKRLYVGSFSCGGTAIGDVDGDGMADIFLTGGAVGNGLFRQTAPWKFEDITRAAGVAGGSNWSAGASMVDIDGDGDLDVYVCNYDKPNQLFINKGSAGTKSGVAFEESAAAWGLDVVDASLMAAFCDYDGDGDLDVFLQCSEYQREGGRPAKPPVIERNGKYSVKPGFEKYYAIKINEHGQQAFVNAGRENYLFRNEGPGKKFTNVTEKAGISGRHFSNSATWWDYNNDGLMDLYVGNDFRDPDQLFHNNGNGTFTEVIKNVMSHTTWFSMGADVGDVNNDGKLDFLIADMAGTTHYVSKATMGEMGKFRKFLMTAIPRQFMRNALYVNTGTPRFLEASFMAGLASTDWTWAIKFGDYDNDGLLDVFFTNGVARSFNDSDNARSQEEYVGKTAWDYWERFPPRKEQNLAYRNGGDLKFEDVSTTWGLDHVGMSYAASTGDLDGDGDLDLIVASLDEEVSLYRNNSQSGSRAVVRLKGDGGNTYGIGAKVTIRTDNGATTHVRRLMPATGFVSCNEPELHFGLGNATGISSLEVEWPDGKTQRFVGDLKVDQRFVISRDGAKDTPAKKANPSVFVRTRALGNTQHRDNYFDDYERQPLLPWRHSSLGPGMAWGDIDGDGDDDFYLSAPKAQAGVIHRNDGNGKFTVRSQKAFDAHSNHEDMAPLFFDADGDGDLDLYVVSGSVECEPGDKTLADRLYLNDGKGTFTDGSDALPDLRYSGSCAVAADYDRDGDLDVFIGSRVIPGAWPETPKSVLLENISSKGVAKFRNIANSDLAGAGLVTSALWSDANNDGWLDLLVTCEWGPVRVFENGPGSNRGTRLLVDRTEEAGLAKFAGWWNGIAGGDVDHDGDIDYVATNFGLNTQYKASPKKPELLYYGDLDGTGRKHIVEAKFEGSICYPRRGLSCSSHAMPGVRKLLPTFKKFALADLEAIYTKDRLDNATKFEVTHLESSLLLNDGKGKFSVQPLPRLAQISPGFGVALADFDGDSNLDCVIAHNFFSPQPETGNMDGGLSVLLRGLGNGKFEPLQHELTGMIVPADSKGLTVLDIDNNGALDVAFGLNSNPVWTFQNRLQGKTFAVALKGPKGNPDAVGARVSCQIKGVAPQIAEVYAGGGYLSQSSPTLRFSRGRSSGSEANLEVRWPNGKTSSHKVEPGKRAISLSQP